MVLFVALFFALVSQSTGQVYEPGTEIYCNGDIHKISEDRLNEKLRCCGKTVYNWDTSRCCNGNVLQIPNNGSDADHWECCGDKWHYWRDDYLVRCCNDKFYNSSNLMCNTETGELVDKDGNAELDYCEGEVYNTSYQQCSNTGLKNQKKVICEMSEPYSAENCCGSKSFDKRYEMCCIDTVHPIYNSTNDNLLNQCCGRDVFPTPNYYRRNSYYIGKYTCCGDEVIEKSSISEQCCGWLLYNRTESLCCEGVLIHTASFGDRCCGSSSYNTELFWCCNGNVYPLSFTPQSCSYNYDELKDTLNLASENIEREIWVYDRDLSEAKTIYNRRLG